MDQRESSGRPLASLLIRRFRPPVKRSGLAGPSTLSGESGQPIGCLAGEHVRDPDEDKVGLLPCPRGGLGKAEVVCDVTEVHQCQTVQFVGAQLLVHIGRDRQRPLATGKRPVVLSECSGSPTAAARSRR